MEYRLKEIKQGINLHFIQTNLFKTDLVAVFLTKKLSRENVTLNTLIPAVLSRGTKTMPTQEDISKTLENMYGAEFDCGIDKTGDNHVMKFYIETLNNAFLLEKEDILKETLEKMLQIIFEPLEENGQFKSEYVQSEKEKVKLLIQSKIDNKDKYAQDRCVEEMYKNELYGLYKYGYIEDLETIDSKKLYEHYKELIQSCKIDIFVSGNFDEENVKKIIENSYIIQKLQPRKPDYVINNETTENKKQSETKTIEEKLDIGQGKLVIGLDILENSEESRYAVSLYNVLLGGSATSKLFQNVREKESLAYSIGSVYLRQKNNIFIKAGIEIENYEKTVELVKEQLEQMKRGEFSDEDLAKAKDFMVFGIKSIIDEQETGVTYYLGQELAGTNITPEQYMEKVNAVTREQIEDIANKISINTVYFLRN